MSASTQGGVLLIDDDPLFAREVERVVPQRHRFLWIDRTADALDEIREREPHFILVDLNMPRNLSMLDEEEGLGVIERLPEEQRSRVIVVTGRLSETTALKLAALGVEQVYLKSEPVSKLGRMMGGVP